MNIDRIKIGARVCFVDENQCEIIGVILKITEAHDHFAILMHLDSGVEYFARLKKVIGNITLPGKVHQVSISGTFE